VTRHIALLAYPDCQLLDVSGPWQVFASANALSPQPLYQLTLIADAVGPVVTNGGLPCMPPTPTSNLLVYCPWIRYW
tara:strand:+ start:1499 stop:1729 length:231 start_codon:yes stop_codon:yes gene_type:complete